MSEVVERSKEEKERPERHLQRQASDAFNPLLLLIRVYITYWQLVNYTRSPLPSCDWLRAMEHIDQKYKIRKE
jgi:hypothetical protein